MKKAKYCENVECERKKQIKGNKINYEENKAKKKKTYSQIQRTD